eukprot:1195394-Prorocentrum_minimum.AAC.9
MYVRGVGVVKDYNVSLQYFRTAASKVRRRSHGRPWTHERSAPSKRLSRNSVGGEGGMNWKNLQ